MRAGRVVMAIRARIEEPRILSRSVADLVAQ